jgi:hypothetical protein
VAALRTLAAAAGDAERASLLMQAGDLGGSLDAMLAALGDAAQPPAERARLQRAMLPVLHEVAVSMAVVQQRDMALQLLDRCRAVLDQGLLARWHLTRAEVFRTLRDLQAAEAELDTIRRLDERGGR